MTAKRGKDRKQSRAGDRPSWVRRIGGDIVGAAIESLLQPFILAGLVIGLLVAAVKKLARALRGRGGGEGGSGRGGEKGGSGRDS